MSKKLNYERYRIILQHDFIDEQDGVLKLDEPIVVDYVTCVCESVAYNISFGCESEAYHIPFAMLEQIKYILKKALIDIISGG